MLNKNIKNLNKILVKNKENMFGGSTKRPPPPSPPSAPSLLLSSLSSSSSSSLAQLQRTAHCTQQLSTAGFSPSTLSPLTTTTLPFAVAAGACAAPPAAVAAAAATTTSASDVSTLSSKSMSVSSFPPKSVSALLPTARLPTEPAVTISGRTNVVHQQQRHRHRQIQQQQQQYHHHHHHHHHTPQLRFRLLPGLKATSFFTILTLVCLETVLLSTVSNCAKTFYMHWNTSNSIFRIDNTDHIIDVNKGNLAFEFDQVHIICPVYEPGTFENETEKYIIYNVSKVEYETCRITNADPRVIAICDKPQKLMFFTITFRPFTPQPGGLEFLPGNDYYFISTSSKDDLYRRIGGRCSTNNMKVVFKVCCAPEDKNNRTNNNIGGGGGGNNNGGIGNGGGNNGIGGSNSGSSNSNTAIQQQHNNNININGGGGGGGGGQLPSPKLPGMGGGMNNGGLMINGNSGTSINTNIDQFNRIPMQQPNNIGGGMGGMHDMGMGGMSGNNGGGIGGQHQTGIRINNVPSSQQHPSQKNDDYDKHPNEVVKNEELTYNSAASSLSFYKMTRRRAATTLSLRKSLRYSKSTYKSIYQKFKSLLQLLLFTSNHRNRINTINTFINFISNCNPIIITTTVLVTLTNLFQYKLSSWSLRRCVSQKAASSSSSTSSAKSTAADDEDEIVLPTNRTSLSSKLRPLLTPSSPSPPVSPVDCIKPTTLCKKLNIASSSTR